MPSQRANRVVWGEGLLVCPQHLQQQEQFFEQYVHSRTSWANPHSWGIVELDIDKSAMQSGDVSIKAFRAVMQGGLVVDLEEGAPGLPPTRPIGPHFSSTAAMVEVYVGLFLTREGGQNYARDSDGNHRFSTWSRDVLDLVDAGSEVEITFAHPRLVVQFGSETSDDAEMIKVAEVRRTPAGAYELVEDFIPTCLQLSGAPTLRRWTRDLLAAMVAKRHSLADALRQVDSSRVEFSAQDVTRYLQLGTINASIPLVQQYAERPEMTPFGLYFTLSQLAGQLTTFSTEIAPESLPRYAHNEQREAFGELFDKLRALLDLAMQENFIDIKLEARRDGMWIGVLKDPRLADLTKYVVSVEADRPQQEVANRVPQLSKIASWKQVPKIVHSAIPGAPLTANHRPPPQIPIRPRCVYFTVDTSHDYWSQIVQERTVAIYLPPPFDPTQTKVRLMAVVDR